MVKIRNIPIEVCSAEQKIAYNVAFSLNWELRSNKDNLEIAYNIVDRSIPDKYDKELIKRIIANNFENYCKGRSVLSSYEEIGNIFKNI